MIVPFAYVVVLCKHDETPDSPLCIGGYSALPSAKLLALGIMQSGLLSALAEPQFCLWSLSIGVSGVIGSVD